MRAVLVILAILTAAQPFRLLQSLLGGQGGGLGSGGLITSSRLNPCGQGVTPTSCTCRDGTTFAPGNAFISAGQACGTTGAPTCLCPNGTSFSPGLPSLLSSLLSSLLGGNLG